MLNRRDLIKSFVVALGIKLDYAPRRVELDEAFTLSLEKYRKEIEDLIFQQNPLFVKLVDDGVSEYGGGIHLMSPVMYDEEEWDA